jgi:hypothetical protein
MLNPLLYRENLNKKMIKYHISGNTKGLLESYIQASNISENTNEKAFFLTQSYVFSLELGKSELSEYIFKQLRELKRI